MRLFTGNSSGLCGLPSAFDIRAGRHAAFLFERLEKMVVAAKAAELADVAHADALKEIFFAEIDARARDVGVQGDACAFFEFSGNVLTGDKKFLLERL